MAAGQVPVEAAREVMPTVAQLFDLSGRVALVTGAGSGLGAVFAEALAEAGASVVCVGRRLERVQETAHRLSEIGCQSLAISADVTDEAAVASMIAQTVERFGKLDILVNNAGTAVVGPPETISLADWQRVVDVNLTGVFLCAREAAKAMIAAGTRGPHHQHRLDPGGGGLGAGAGRGLRRDQGRGGQPDAGPGRALGATWHPRQRHRPGLLPLGDDRRLPGAAGDAARDRTAHAAGADRPAGGTQRSGGLFRLRGVVLRHRPDPLCRRRLDRVVAADHVDGVVELSGEVSRGAERVTAEAGVLGLPGVVDGRNRIMVADVPVQVEQIETTIREAFTAEVAAAAARITAQVKGGQVTLTGTTSTLHHRQLAERAALNVMGVSEVRNEIQFGR